MTDLLLIGYISDAKSFGEKTTAQFNVSQVKTEAPVMYLKSPAQANDYATNSLPYPSSPYLPKVAFYQRTSGELFAESTATGQFTDQDVSQYVKNDIATGAYYVKTEDGRYLKVTDLTLYVEGPGTGFSPYVPPVKYLRTPGTNTYTPNPIGNYVRDYDGKYTTDASVLNPMVVTLRVRKATDNAMFVYQAMLRSDFYFKLKKEEARHHELACRVLPMIPTLSYSYLGDTKKITMMNVRFEIPKSPDCLGVEVYGVMSGPKFIWDMTPSPHPMVEGLNKDLALYIRDWKHTIPAPLGVPGEMITFKSKYKRNRPYIVSRYYSTPALTGGIVTGKKPHPDPLWMNTTLSLYEVTCEGTVLSDILPTDFTEYAVGDWVSLMKVTQQTANIDPVEHIVQDIRLYKGKFTGYTVYRDKYVTEFVYRVCPFTMDTTPAGP